MDVVKQAISQYLNENELAALPTDIKEFARIVKAGLITNPSTTGASVDKGKRGEKFVKDILAKYRPVSTMRNHAGDLCVGGLCIEVKDYSNTVPKTEVDKFMKDLVSSNANAGLFISLSSAIVSMNTLEHRVEVISGRKVPIVFVTSDCPELIQLAAELLLVETQARVVSTLDYTLQDDIIDKIDIVIDSMKGLKDSRDSLGRMMTNTTNTVYGIQQNLMSVEAIIRANLDSLRGDCRVVVADEEITKVDINRFKHVHNRELVEKIIGLLGAKDATLWKIGAVKAEKNNYCLHFNKSDTSISLPIDKVDKSLLATLLSEGAKCSYKRCVLSITEKFEPMIMKMITGE
jgi:hypothetical protein